jgi:hypothetical protein
METAIFLTICMCVCARARTHMCVCIYYTALSQVQANTNTLRVEQYIHTASLVKILSNIHESGLHKFTTHHELTPLLISLPHTFFYNNEKQSQQMSYSHQSCEKKYHRFCCYEMKQYFKQ